MTGLTVGLRQAGYKRSEHWREVCKLSADEYYFLYKLAEKNQELYHILTKGTAAHERGFSVRELMTAKRGE